MNNRTFDSLNLFNDESEAELDEVLQLDKRSFVAAVERLKSGESVSVIRRMILDLKQELRDPGARLRSTTANDDVVEFTSNYLNEELNQIASSHTLERALYYVEPLVKSVTEIRVSEINDINLNRWKECTDIYLDSLWIIDRRESSGVHTAGYWGNFIPQIPYQMMRRYTKKGDWVLDTFAGAGTTLIEGQRCGRNTLGIELQPDVAEQARRTIGLEPNTQDVVSEVVVGDSAAIDYASLLARHDRQSVQLIIMHPPYFDIIKIQ
jgi:hypothetical protein